MPRFLGLISGLVVFGVWMSIVGNPHVAETAIGLLLAVGVGTWIYLKSRKLFSKRDEQ